LLLPPAGLTFAGASSAGGLSALHAAESTMPATKSGRRAVNNLGKTQFIAIEAKGD
jgi:hypothetical protein